MSANNLEIESDVKKLNLSDRRPLIHTAVAIAVLAGVEICLLTGLIDFSRQQETRVQNLTDIGPRIQYVLQHSTPGVVWIFFCIVYVISKRAGTQAVIPTSGHEHLIESAKNILTNSLEQFIMSFLSQLILITYLTPRQVLNVIPVLNLVFITGRVFFWLGYPANRVFGMMLNLLTLFATILYISYHYFYLFL